MEEIDDLWDAHKDRTVPFDRRFGGPARRSSWCTSDHGVACGTDRSGTHRDHRKGTRIGRAHCRAVGAQEATKFRPHAPIHVRFWSLADISQRIKDVRFTLENRHSNRKQSPL